MDNQKNENKKKSTTIDANKKNYVRFNFLLYVEMGEQRVQADNHLNRLESLRKELNNLKKTEWQYDPIEKYIGQA